MNLSRRVIDAWIGCCPDVPGVDDNDLTFFHLTRLPVRLVVAQDHPLLELGEAITMEDVKRYSSLALPDHAFPKFQGILQGLGLWNLLLNLRRYRDNWQNKIQSGLAVGYTTSFTHHLFRSPQVVLPLQIPLEVGETVW